MISYHKHIAKEKTIACREFSVISRAKTFANLNLDFPWRKLSPKMPKNAKIAKVSALKICILMLVQKSAEKYVLSSQKL